MSVLARSLVRGIWRGKGQAPAAGAAVVVGPPSVFNTLDRFWTLWRAVSWLSEHKQYFSLGVVLVEYVTRTALSYLPHDQEERYERLLALIGLDVRDVGLAAVGQSALSVALTGGAFVAPSAAAPLPLHERVQADLREAMARMRRVARMPPHLDEAMHARFARALHDGHRPTFELAVLAYGPERAEWTRGGCRAHGGDLVSADDCRRAYEEWHAFCQGAVPLIDGYGERAVQAIGTLV